MDIAVWVLFELMPAALWSSQNTDGAAPTRVTPNLWPVRTNLRQVFTDDVPHQDAEVVARQGAQAELF